MKLFRLIPTIIFLLSFQTQAKSESFQIGTKERFLAGAQTQKRPYIPKSTYTVGQKECFFTIDTATHYTMTARARIYGTHPGLKRPKTPEPREGLASGDDRSHLIPIGAVRDINLVNVPENIISQPPHVNRGVKQKFDLWVSKLADDMPERTVEMEVEPLRHVGTSRPYGIVCRVYMDGVLFAEKRMLNEK